MQRTSPFPFLAISWWFPLFTSIPQGHRPHEPPSGLLSNVTSTCRARAAEACAVGCPVLQFSSCTCRWRQTQSEIGQSKAKEPRLALQKDGMRHSVYSAVLDSSDLSCLASSHIPNGRNIIQLRARSDVTHSSLAVSWTPPSTVPCLPFPSAPVSQKQGLCQPVLPCPLPSHCSSHSSSDPVQC